MSYAAVQDLLTDHLATVPGLPPLQEENTRNQVKSTTAFSRVTLLPASAVQLTVGQHGRDRVEGLLQVDLFHPIDTGIAAPNALADAVVAHFPRGTTLTDGATTVHVGTVSRLTGGRIEAFYQTPVQVRWAIER